MAISTKMKNVIVAMWKTGEFKSFTSIAKHYKISTKTAQKIIGNKAHSNEDVIELGVKYEMAKKSTKNPHEINSIEKVVKGRVDTIDIDNILVKQNRIIAKATQSVISEKIRNNELTLKNVKNVTGAIKDIEAIANPTSSGTEVNIQNNQSNVNVQTRSFNDMFKEDGVITID